MHPLFILCCKRVFAVRERQRGYSRSAVLLFVFDHDVVRERQMDCCYIIMENEMGIAFLQLDWIGSEISLPRVLVSTANRASRHR